MSNGEKRITKPAVAALFAQKKWRTLGQVVTEAEVKRANAWVRISRSSHQDLVTYESRGLVVSINGSGSLPVGHPQCQEAVTLTEYVIARGGIILNGGRNSGIMEASSRVAGAHGIGIIFPELKKEANAYGVKAIVSSPTPRIELLAVCAPIVVIFRGGLGTLMALLQSIVHLRNLPYHPELPPQTIFVSNYWIGLLTTMQNLGCLPREFLAELHFFDQATQICKRLPTVS